MRREPAFVGVPLRRGVIDEESSMRCMGQFCMSLPLDESDVPGPESFDCVIEDCIMDKPTIDNSHVIDVIADDQRTQA